MSMIREANNDDAFNRQMMKIQDAIEALEKLAPTMDPVGSQLRMLEISGDDLKKLAASLKAKKK